MPNAEATKLTKTVTVARYRELEAAGDRAACGEFIVQRFHERYFEPTVNAPTRHGFTLMAIACLVIEALECFYQGEADSNRRSGAKFKSFFARPTGLQVFASADNWFYEEVRCAILHQAETVGGWRLRRKGKVLDEAMRVINAKRFVELLQAAVADYAKQLETDDKLWVNFRKKMDAVCKNCDRPA